MPFDSRDYEYADIKVMVFGKILTGLRGLTYKKSQEKELVYGQGNDAQQIRRGNKKNDGTLLLLKSDYDALDAAAVAAGYDDIIDVPGELITITCAYQKDSLSTQLTVDSLKNVEFTEAEDGMKQGDKFKEVSLPFIFLKKKKV